MNIKDTQQIDKLLWEKFPHILTDVQKKNKIGNLLTELRKEGKIKNMGGFTNSVWTLN
jgi:hypothetical protein